MRSYKLCLRAENFLVFVLSVLMISVQPMASHGPEGGGINIAIDPNDPNIVYRASSNGMFKSTDGGESWQRMDGPINFGVLDIRINPMNPNIMYVQGVINEIWGIYKSMDGGTNWRLVLTDGAWFDMDLMNPDTLYAVKIPGGVFIEGIFKTTDGGETWALSLENRALGPLAIHPIETNTIYVGGNGVHKSTDGGESWTVVGLAGIGVSSIFLEPVDVNTLYANVNYQGIGWRLAKSTDGGVNWERLPIDLYGWLAVDPDDTRVLYMGVWEQPEQRGIHKSIDGGESWRRVGNFFPWGNIAINPGDMRIVYAGARAGTAKSTNGGESWEIFSRGFTATQIGSIAIAPSDTSRLYADIWRSTNAGESWAELGSIEAGVGVAVAAVDPSDPNIVYGWGSDEGQRAVKKSEDAGDSWRTVLRENVGPVAVDPTDPNIVYAGASSNPFSSDVFKSTDGGDNWTLIATLPAFGIRALAIDPNDSQIIYAGATRWGVYKSTDGGERWDFSGLADSWIMSITIDENDPRNIYVAANNGVFKSEDGGGSWTRLGTIWARSVVIDPSDRNILYAGNEVGGVYKSTDGGQTWEPRNRGLTNTRINHLAISRDTGRLYAATAGAGVWFSDDGAESWE